MSHGIVDWAATNSGRFIWKHEPEKRLPLLDFWCIINYQQLAIRINLDSGEITDGADEFAFQAENAQREITRQMGLSAVNRAYDSIKRLDGLENLILKYLSWARG